MLTLNVPEEAPRTIDEIGDRTFKVKEQLWALNTVGNLKYIWCKDMLERKGKHIEYAYPAPFLTELTALELRLKKLSENDKTEKHEISKEQTIKDIESIQKQITDLKNKQCPECVQKLEFRLDRLANSGNAEAIALGAGPSVLDKDSKLLPKVISALKRSNYPIAAADRALIPCLKEGIIPKYVVAADGADHVADYFKGDIVKQAVKEHDILGIFNTQIHPNVSKIWIEECGGKALWYNVMLDSVQKTKSLSRYLIHMTYATVVSVPWGHVGGYQFGFLFLLGYKPIILMGIDLGFAPNDEITDTPYWNPYFKATIREHILHKIGYPIKVVSQTTGCFECGAPKPQPKTLTEFNANNPEHIRKFEEAAKELEFNNEYEYTSKDKEFYEKHKEFYNKTIKEHFTFYDNPFGYKVYHDNIFKAYKDIMFSFFAANPTCQIVQASDYCTLFPIPCDVCKGTMKINKKLVKDKECPKCHSKARIEELGEQIPCPACMKYTGNTDGKGNPILKPCGVKGNSIRCMSLDDYLNSKLTV